MSENADQRRCFLFKRPTAQTAHSLCILSCIHGTVILHSGHFLLQPRHMSCMQSVVLRRFSSFGSTRSGWISLRQDIMCPCPHTQQSYIFLGVNISLTCQSSSSLVIRLALSIRRRTRRNRTRSFQFVVGSAELMRMQCSSR